MDCLVSFIIPARNEQRMIGNCLDAINVLVQNRGLYECIVVDNGSVDQTPQIAKAKGAMVFTLPDVTISTLRNFGAQKSRGEFLAFIDCDCVVAKNWLQNALFRLRDPTVGCVGSYPIIPEECSWVQRAWALQNQVGADVEDVDWLPSMNIIVRRGAFMEVGGFNESLITCEDVDFCYRLKKKRCRIISDMNVKAVHYGEARTVLEFFEKERWRGQSNLQGFLSHGFSWREVPSLILPLFYLICMTSLPFTLIQLLRGSPGALTVNIGLMFLPASLLSVRTSLKARKFTSVAELTFLYFVYSIARAVALLPIKLSRRRFREFA